MFRIGWKKVGVPPGNMTFAGGAQRGLRLRAFSWQSAGPLRAIAVYRRLDKEDSLLQVGDNLAGNGDGFLLLAKQILRLVLAPLWD